MTAERGSVTPDRLPSGKKIGEVEKRVIENGQKGSTRMNHEQYLSGILDLRKGDALDLINPGVKEAIETSGNTDPILWGKVLERARDAASKVQQANNDQARQREIERLKDSFLLAETLTMDKPPSYPEGEINPEDQQIYSQTWNAVWEEMNSLKSLMSQTTPAAPATQVVVTPSGPTTIKPDLEPGQATDIALRAMAEAAKPFDLPDLREIPAYLRTQKEDPRMTQVKELAAANRRLTQKLIMDTLGVNRADAKALIETLNAEKERTGQPAGIPVSTPPAQGADSDLVRDSSRLPTVNGAINTLPMLGDEETQIHKPASTRRRGISVPRPDKKVVSWVKDRVGRRQTPQEAGSLTEETPESERVQELRLQLRDLAQSNLEGNRQLNRGMLRDLGDRYPEIGMSDIVRMYREERRPLLAELARGQQEEITVDSTKKPPLWLRVADSIVGTLGGAKIFDPTVLNEDYFIDKIPVSPARRTATPGTIPAEAPATPTGSIQAAEGTPISSETQWIENADYDELLARRTELTPEDLARLVEVSPLNLAQLMLIEGISIGYAASVDLPFTSEDSALYDQIWNRFDWIWDEFKYNMPDDLTPEKIITDFLEEEEQGYGRKISKEQFLRALAFGAHETIKRFYSDYEDELDVDAPIEAVQDQLLDLLEERRKTDPGAFQESKNLYLLSQALVVGAKL